MDTKRRSDYADFVRLLARIGENRTFLNSDEEHALTVLVQLFQTAKEEIRVFAGCLYEHIGDSPEYIIALSEFIERGGKLYILLNAYDENRAKESNLFKRLSYYKSLGKPVSVKTSGAHPYVTRDGERKEVHFTVADGKAYRIETDTEKRSAVCNFNNPALAEQVTGIFDTLFTREDAEEVDLLNLFGNGDK